MPEKPVAAKKLSEKNTKQEMLEAYQTLVKQLEEKRASELNPEKKLETKKAEEAVRVAETLSADGIDRDISTLKAEIGKTLADLSEKLAAEAAKFRAVQKAAESKTREIEELYGIERSAASLAALIEAQNQKRRNFEIELEQQKEELAREIQANRDEWEKEKKAHEAEIKERDALEKKAREREKEEFGYQFKREQQAIKDKLTDEKTTLENLKLAPSLFLSVLALWASAAHTGQKLLIHEHYTYSRGGHRSGRSDWLFFAFSPGFRRGLRASATDHLAPDRNRTGFAGAPRRGHGTG